MNLFQLPSLSLSLLLVSSVPALRVAGAEEKLETVSPPPSQRFNDVSVRYTFRTFTGGVDGDGVAHSVDLGVSREWLIRTNGAAVAVQIAPALGFMNGEYDLRRGTSHTMDAGVRVGLLVHDPTRRMALALFTDTAWNLDSIEGRPQESGILFKPGLEIHFRLDTKQSVLRQMGFQIGYRYCGLTSHEVDLVQPGGDVQRVDFRRADNSLDNEIRYGVTWNPLESSDGNQFRSVAVSTGVTQCFGSGQSSRSALGWFLTVRKTF